MFFVEDLTSIVWDEVFPKGYSKIMPIARMKGHQKLVNAVAFSPNGLFIALVSFENRSGFGMALQERIFSLFESMLGSFSRSMGG